MTGLTSDHPAPWRSRQWRRDLACRWAAELGKTAYLPMTHSAVEAALLELVEEISAALEDPPSIEQIGVRVGSQLVDMHATGHTSLPVSLQLLREALPAAFDNDPVQLVLSLIASVAAGYAEADRERTFAQQETMKQALLRSALRAERNLEVSEAQFQEVFASMPIGSAISDVAGNIVAVNPALQRNIGYSTGQLTSMAIHELFHSDETAYLTAAYAELAKGTLTSLRERRRMVRADGAEVWTFLAVSVLRDANGAPQHFVTMVEDSSELHLLQERFHFQALHDSLTGLPNRQYFLSRLEAAMATLPKDAYLSLYHLSLDGFELINDGLGHDVGDSIVKAVARRLESVVSNEEGMVARLGGTEFAILLREVPDTPSIPAFTEQINQELSEPVYIGSHGIATSASIGVVRRTKNDGTPGEMMWAADVALRSAKTAGSRQWAMFDPDRAPQERTEARLSAIMPGALELGEFEVLYRPVVLMDSGQIVGLEAELFWQPEDHRRLEHTECLRLAERSGITLSLRDWTLRSGWEWLGDWHRAGYRTRLIIGLSPNQAGDPDLIKTVREVLRKGDLSAEWLQLCLPVCAVVDENRDTRDNIQVLSEMGVQTALHDFKGSPLELHSLRELPIQAVRFSDDLVRMVHAGDWDAPEVRAVARMMPSIHECGVPLAICGIDTPDQAARWKEMGCEIAAGDLYGDPVSSADVPRLLGRG